ncbi:MAG: type II/IV secretion system protein [Pirellulaceae bacterium]|nr:type II/IV secretion system protein [Pirellulaceae bacterium]
MEAETAVDAVVRHAARLRSSDLFLLSNEKSVNIAVRRLGTVQQLGVVSREKGKHMISYIKAQAGMDISELRRPMDGRWLLDLGHKKLDFRINCVATLHGIDMTLRMWDHDLGLRSIDQLGLGPADLSRLIGWLSRPSGLLLVTGPTGTGKTTTLYACLQYLNNGERKINTLEDPVEYALEGIRQSHVNPRLGLDFPELLRNVLRQAPDVIMIGEIRDEETALTAVRAANSGHLVLATLHAAVAANAVQSMLALGAQPYFLSACLLGIVAQRLVRTLCPKCRVFYDLSEAPQTFEEIRPLLQPGEGQAIYGPSGCHECYEVGYAGRTGLFELLTMNLEIRRLIAQARPPEEIQAAAVRNGMIEFRRGALLKVAQGVTSTEEILRDVPAEYLGLED